MHHPRLLQKLFSSHASVIKVVSFKSECLGIYYLDMAYLTMQHAVMPLQAALADTCAAVEAWHQHSTARQEGGFPGVTITFFLEEILLTFCSSLLLCSDSFVIGLPGPVSEVWTWNIVSWELMLDLICWWQTFTQQNQVMSVLSFLMPCAMQQRYHRNLVLHLINRQWLHFSLNNNSYEVYSSNSNPLPLSFW